MSRQYNENRDYSNYERDKRQRDQDQRQWQDYKRDYEQFSRPAKKPKRWAKKIYDDIKKDAREYLPEKSLQKAMDYVEREIGKGKDEVKMVFKDIKEDIDKETRGYLESVPRQIVDELKQLGKEIADDTVGELCTKLIGDIAKEAKKGKKDAKGIAKAVVVVGGRVAIKLGIDVALDAAEIVAEQVGEALLMRYAAVLAEYGLEVSFPAYSAAVTAFFDMLRGDTIAEMAGDIAKKAIEDYLMEYYGISLDKLFLDQFLEDPSMAKIVGRTARFLLERMGYDTEKNYLFSKFLNDPEAAFNFKKAMKDFIEDAKKKGRAKFKKFRESLFEVEEELTLLEEEAEGITEAEEAMSLAEIAMDMAPLLLL